MKDSAGMLKRLKSALFIACLGLASLLLPRTGNAAATVLSVSFVNGDPAIHIGSVITVNMAVLDVTATLSGVSVVSATVTDLTLGSLDLNSVSFSTVYVTDGQRTWKVSVNAASPTLVINNGNRLGSGAVSSWASSDFTQLQNQSYRMYLGNPLPGASGALVSAKLGDFGNVVLNDGGGNAPDVTQNDEVWSAAYTVPDLGMVITDSRMYGRAYYGGTVATNDQFVSNQALSIDALRPQIKLVNFTVPSRPNYNNVLYLSEACQGITTPASTNSQGRFDIEVNKNNTIVDITIATSPPKSLPAIVLPAGSGTKNAWMVWDGDDGNGRFVPDGIYHVDVYVHDGYGVTGVTRTSQVRVTSLRFEITNIRMSPSGREVEPKFSSGLITTINSDVIAYRDLSGSVRASFAALGWDDGLASSYGSNDLDGSIYAVQDVKFLNQSGVETFGLNNLALHDVYNNFDYDTVYAGDYGLVGGDGSKTNDWEPHALTVLSFTAGTAVNPTTLIGPYTVSIIGTSPDQGNYRLRLRSRLCKLMAVFVNTAGGYHFYPNIDLDNDSGGTESYGQGIYAEDSSLIFQVLASNPTVSDTTPPVFLTSSPLDNATVLPTVYGPAPSFQALTAQFQDSDSAMNASGQVSFITVKDPQGGAVPGVSSTDGGGINNTLKLSFQPSVMLNRGGLYTMTVNTCNTAGLCVAKDIKVTVKDQTPPSVSAVELVLQSSVTQALSINQSSAEGPFQGVADVNVTLSIPSTSTNTIDWDQSNVSLYQITGSTRVPVSMRRLTVGTPSDGKLRYEIVSPINTAGVYEISTQTFSKDSAGNSYVGPPAGTIMPQFTTVACLTCVTVLFAAPGNDSSRPAISASYPLTLTSGVLPLNANLVGVDSPSGSSLPNDPGWATLSSTLFSTSMRFFVGGVLQTSPLTWTYPATSTVAFHMYYNDGDLPSGINETDLQVRAYVNGAWTTLTNVQQNSLPLTSNSFTFSPTSSQQAGLYYRIAYPSVTIVPGGANQPTAIPFKNSRSFNPTHRNPIYRAARFYYSDVPVKSLEAKVYDAGGTLIRSLSVGNGIVLTNSTTDLIYGNSSYYFDWDGRNDNGDLVKNGLYLVRWQLTKTDGSQDSQVKPVALIK